jgi:hypothetical protein
VIPFPCGSVSGMLRLMCPTGPGGQRVVGTRTDGERVYLTDSGPATSPHFDLSAAERDFAARHATHDAGYAAMRLVNWLVTDVCPGCQCRKAADRSPQRVRTPMRRRLRSG